MHNILLDKCILTYYVLSCCIKLMRPHYDNKKLLKVILKSWISYNYYVYCRVALSRGLSSIVSTYSLNKHCYLINFIIRFIFEHHKIFQLFASYSWLLITSQTNIVFPGNLHICSHTFKHSKCM